MRLKMLIAACVCFLVLGCQKESEETNTKGTVHLVIPESLAPVMTAEVKAFLQLYQQNGATVSFETAAAREAFHRFVRDTMRLVFLSYRLTDAEKEQTMKVSPDFEEILLAYDGVVVVANKKNAFEEMTTTEVKNILTGSIHSWEQLSRSKGTKGKINIVFHDSSDVAVYLQTRFSLQQLSPSLWSKTQSDMETIETIAKDRNALGFVSLAWFDSLKTAVKAVSLSSTERETDTLYRVPPEAVGNYFSPHPANIYQKYYPLWWTVYAYCRTPYSNVAAGFVSYVAGAEGQKAFIQKGLVPGTGTLRIHLKSSNY